MKPNYDLNEAREMLAMAYVADLLGPGQKVPDKKGKGKHYENIGEISNDPKDPLKDDDGKHFPYTVMPIWPKGWEPAVSADLLHLKQPWFNSILRASPIQVPSKGQFKDLIEQLEKNAVGSKIGTNNVILAYNRLRDSYAISFAGTENILGMVEDIFCLPVTARGNLDLQLLDYKYKSSANYMLNPDYYDYKVNPKKLPAQPPIVEPLIHCGIRMAVEAYTVKAKKGASNNLIEVFTQISKSRKGKAIDLYVTGHSLGGGMAQAFTAWLQTNPIPDVKINPKMYSFAAPKIFNDVAANNFDTGCTMQGYAYRVANSLDSVPQLGFTLEGMAQLQNPRMIPKINLAKFALNIENNYKLPHTVSNTLKELATIYNSLNKEKADKALGFILNMNYVHVGVPIILMGTYPVVYNEDCINPTQQVPYPPKYFPGGANESKSLIGLMERQWWQHWPCVYRELM
jgi:hypothetical protein